MRTRQVKDSELRKEWKRIDEALISPELLREMPQPECTALTLLVDAMINSTVCDLGPGHGQITAKVDDEIYIIIDVEQTVRNRISKLNTGEDVLPRRNRYGTALYRDAISHQTTMNVWVIKPEDGFKLPTCVHGPKASIPALDDCASFVYWAEAGFPNPPATISDAILHARDPAAWQKAVDMRARNHRETRQIERMRQELLHAESLERQRKEKEAEAERHRVMSLGWRGLIDEHQEVGFPITGDDMLDGRRSDISHMLRESLLDPDARTRARAKSRAARESHENLQQERFYRNVSVRRNENNE